MFRLKTATVIMTLLATNLHVAPKIESLIPENIREIDDQFKGIKDSTGLSKDFAYKVYNDLIYTFEEGYNGSDCNHGIMATTLRKAIKQKIVKQKHISQLTKEESRLIMYKMVFLEYRVDTLLSNNQPKSTAYIYDFLINANPAGALKYVQRAIGVPTTCKLDKATRARMSLYSDDDLLDIMASARLTYYTAIIANNSHLAIYKKAWVKRARIAKEMINDMWSETT